MNALFYGLTAFRAKVDERGEWGSGTRGRKEGAEDGSRAWGTRVSDVGDPPRIMTADRGRGLYHSIRWWMGPAVRGGRAPGPEGALSTRAVRMRATEVGPGYDPAGAARGRQGQAFQDQGDGQVVSDGLVVLARVWGGPGLAASSPGIFVVSAARHLKGGETTGSDVNSLHHGAGPGLDGTKGMQLRHWTDSVPSWRSGRVERHGIA